jgi:hypothetical protein
MTKILDPARVAQFIKSPHGLFNIKGLQQGERERERERELY